MDKILAYTFCIFFACFTYLIWVVCHKEHNPILRAFPYVLGGLVVALTVCTYNTECAEVAHHNDGFATTIQLLSAGVFCLAHWLHMKEILAEKNKIKELKKKAETLAERLKIITKALRSLDDCTTLNDVFVLHKSLAIPLQLNSSRNLGPCSYGIFRTDDIATMKKSEVYLGDIYGLWTNTLEFFERCEDDMSGNGWGINPDTKIKDLIFKQYFNHIQSNLKAMLRDEEHQLQRIRTELHS